MKYKEYKIWRFAYESCENKLLIPDNIKLYCVDYHRNEPERKCEKISIKLGRDIFNETYITIMPYTDELWNLSNNKDQTNNLSVFNVNNKYIIWLIEQIFPLDDEFPYMKEEPIFPITYLQYRTKRVEFNKTVYMKYLNELNSMDLTEDERVRKIGDKYLPIYEYVKIHGFNEQYKGNLDITRVTVKSWIDGSEYLSIRKESTDIKNVLNEKLDESLEYIDETTYNNSFNETVNKLK